MIKLKVDSMERTDMIEITDAVKKAVKESGVTSGICLLRSFSKNIGNKKLKFIDNQWIWALLFAYLMV